MTVEQRRGAVQYGNDRIAVCRQCELLELPRSTLYYRPRGPSDEDLQLMRLLDEQFTRTPFYGSRKMTAWLCRQDCQVNRKRVVRLMRDMGLQTIYPGPRLSKPAKGHKIYPYLLRGRKITRADEVWSADITYIRLSRGFVYLMAVIDWWSRYVLAWELSITLDSGFCVAALERALEVAGRPEIFNTDQGAQFTSEAFLSVLQGQGVRISMDGRGRALDNAFVERLWRSVKYEDVYLKDYQTPIETGEGLGGYFRFYNEERLHQALDYRTPAEVYAEKVINTSCLSAVGR